MYGEPELQLRYCVRTAGLILTRKGFQFDVFIIYLSNSQELLDVEPYCK